MLLDELNSTTACFDNGGSSLRKYVGPAGRTRTLKVKVVDSAPGAASLGRPFRVSMVDGCVPVQELLDHVHRYNVTELLWDDAVLSSRADLDLASVLESGSYEPSDHSITLKGVFWALMFISCFERRC